ncbi:MAG: FAD-dependent monooxygenase [Myxococcota bacterium]
MGLDGKVLIVGSGIGGLTLAHALRVRGIAHEIFEQARQLSDVGAGLLLHPGALAALSQLGLRQAVERAGHEILHGLAITSGGAVLQDTSLAALRDDVGAGTFGIHRARLQEVLLAGLEEVRLGRRFERYEADASGVTAHFSDGSSARGALLVGADGLRSRVRQQLLGAEPLRYAGYTSWRGVARMENPFGAHELREIWGRGERFGIVPIDEQSTYWFAVANAPEGERDEDALAEVERRFANWSEEIRKLLAASQRERVLRTDIHDRDPVPRWSQGRVTLLGDAAHPMTPNLGQGACMSIEDSVVLAARLHESESLDAALASYERQRFPRTSRMVRSSRQLGQLAQLESPLLIFLRDLMLRATPKRVVEKQLRENARFAP